MYCVGWSLARWSKIPKASFKNGAQGALILSKGCWDNQIGIIDIHDTGSPDASMGAGFWMFSSCKRNSVDSLLVDGLCYHGVYIDDRTTVGSEWDAECTDNTIVVANINIPRSGSNTGSNDSRR